MNTNHDPEAARFITEDINRFWAVFPALDEPNAEVRFELEYFQAGTPGLRSFVQLRIGTAKALLTKIRSCRCYYASIQRSTQEVPLYAAHFRASFRRLAELYPEAVFPDTTFVIGRMNSGGTTDTSGLLIGTELFSRAPDSPVEELDDWERAVTLPVADLPFIVAHELIHVQQPSEQELTLLAQCLREGAAEFLGELVSGRVCTPHIHHYGKAHEQELWTRFSREMQGQTIEQWLYQGRGSEAEPADLGYFVGAQICRAYLDTHQDRRQAVHDLIHRAVWDPTGFLADSGYARGFMV